MIQPEQLSLDFSAPAELGPPATVKTASIHRLDHARAAREARERQRIYDAIFETIRHIDVGRKTARRTTDLHSD